MVFVLLEWFYDFFVGEVFIDDVNIKGLQFKWFWCQIGLVSQEFVFFVILIKENILYGKDGVLEEEIVEVVKLVNVFNFII